MRPEDLNQIRDWIDQFFRWMGFQLSSTVLEKDGVLQINITGEDRPYFIADEGETILSWQFLLAKIIRQKMQQTVDLHILVDSDGFMSRHDEELRQLAYRTMQRVRKERRRVKLPAMNPYDRRIIHTEVARNPELDTISEGEGFFKHIIIQRRRY